MRQPVWAKVRKDVGFRPLTEGRIGADCPLYLERWVYQARSVSVSGIACPVLVTQLGGARVREGDERHWRFTSLPSQSILIPPGTPTNWHYSGPVDDVALYLLDADRGIQGRLARLVAAHGEPMPFSDALVAAGVRQLADELHGGAGTDENYISTLAAVLLEQVFRVLTAATAPSIHTQHAHYSRLQKVLRHIDAHLADPLSATALAALAGVSESHFRRIFTEATGMPPHRYVHGRRLAQARRLLALSDLPIAVIADECGFYSQSHLTRSFRAMHAETPAAYRRHQAPRAAASPSIRSVSRLTTE
jgi:AraC family transcriptional regulator